MKKKYFIVFVFAFSVSSCYFNLFDKEERLIKTIHNNNGDSVKFFYVSSNAATEDVIQVRKVDKNNDETFITALEHNFLESAEFVTSDSLTVILTDTTAFGESKLIDTIGIRLK